MEQALREVGFTGVETVDGVIYARVSATLPEFTVSKTGDIWQLAQAWPLRASEAQIAAWTALNPHAPMDLFQGETRITLPFTPENLGLWAGLVEQMVAKCTQWRRATRQRDEGM
jgi:hypothetical protein